MERINPTMDQAHPPIPNALDSRMVAKKHNEESWQNAEKEKQNIEFQRYKQDCRKRALDLAIEQSSKVAKDLEGIVSKDGKIIPYEIVQQLICEPLADKYYNWLISIPE